MRNRNDFNDVIRIWIDELVYIYDIKIKII